LCGGKRSKGKHYVSKIGRGIFTEKPFLLKSKKVRLFTYMGKRDPVFTEVEG